MPSNSGYSTFLAFASVQTVLIVLYGVFCKYSEDADTFVKDETNRQVQDIYAMFQDIHVMMFIGFGFLMTFLKKYTFGALGFTMFITVIALQWGTLCVNFWRQVMHNGPFKKIEISIEQLVIGDFSAAAVLISFGGVIGKVSPHQLMFMTIVELVLYGLNEAIATQVLYYEDIGGSIVIHMFGAYFGLTVAWILSKGVNIKPGFEFCSSTHKSDTFAMIGTLFLWMYWPSFNAALAGTAANKQHRAAINTLFSLCGSTLWTFGLSWILRGGKFNMVDIQNATLAGGVAMGAAAHMRTTLWGALVVGSIGGIISSLGFARLQEILFGRFGLHDSCGIHNLHAMPGLFGGFVSVFFAGIATVSSDYGTQYGEEGLLAVFPHRSSRSASEQAGYQLAGMAVCLGIAIGGGIVTGFIMRYAFKSPETIFDDYSFWHVEDSGDVEDSAHRPLGWSKANEDDEDEGGQGNNGTTNGNGHDQ